MSGSIYKRCGTCGRRVQGRACSKCGSSNVGWAYTVTVGRDSSGKRIRQGRSGFRSKKEAERALVEIQASLAEGSYVKKSTMTVDEFLTEEWLPATAPPRIRHETWDDRRRNLLTHVIPDIGNVRLQELNTAHVNRLYARLLETGRVDGEGGLSPTTVRRIHAMLRKACNDAVRWGFLVRNPVIFADPPSGKVVKASMRREMQTWSAEELTTFLRETEGHPLHLLWVLAACTGMRRSELLGARWADIAIEARTVTVRQTIVQTPHGYQPTLDQKTLQSARTIHVDKRTAHALQHHREQLDEVGRQVGPNWNTYDLVFPRADGQWWNPPAVSLSFRRAVARVGVPRIRFHDVRHTHATLLLTAGTNPKIVSERLGHSSVAFTLDTYAHVMPGMQPETAEAFAELLYGREEGEASELP